MPKIVWNESYSVGVAELDTHHRQLADLINRLTEYRQIPCNLAFVDDTLATTLPRH